MDTSTPVAEISNFRRRIAWIFIAAGTIGLVPCGYGFYISGALREDELAAMILVWLFLLYGLLLYAGYIRLVRRRRAAGFESLLWINTIIYNAICVLIFGYLISADSLAIPAACWNIMAIIFSSMALNDLAKESRNVTRDNSTSATPLKNAAQ